MPIHRERGQDMHCGTSSTRKAQCNSHDADIAAPRFPLTPQKLREAGQEFGLGKKQSPFPGLETIIFLRKNLVRLKRQNTFFITFRNRTSPKEDQDALVTGLVPTWYQVGTGLVPSWYRLGINLGPAWYQVGISLEPNINFT